MTEPPASAHAPGPDAQEQKSGRPRSRPSWRPTRRGLLVGVLAGGGLAIGAAVGLRKGREALTGFINGQDMAEVAFGELPREPTVWLEVHVDGRTTLFLPKAEMGQGIHTGLAQIAADALGADWELLDVLHASSTRGFGRLNLDTGGSTSLRSTAPALRAAASALRELLLAEASRQLKVPPDRLQAVDSRVRTLDGSNRTLSFGDIVARRSGAWPSIDPARVGMAMPVRRLEGSRVPRVDLPDKIRGRAVYGYDVRVPGMLFGAVARPPRYGATLASAREGKAATVPGVVRIVVEPGFAGVVATRRTAAWKAAALLELEWRGGTQLGQSELERLVRVDAARAVRVVSRGASPQGVALHVVEREFRTAMVAHAALEPQAAMVDVRPGRVNARLSTQLASMAVRSIAEASQRKAGQVDIEPVYLGGSFGRKSGHDVGAEAARLSAAVGRPVHVGWSRADDFRFDFFRPPTHHCLRAALSPSGRIESLIHDIASGDVALSFGANPLPGGETGAALLGFDPGTVIAVPGPYDVGHVEVTMTRVKLPVPTGSWRGLGAVANTFALESLIDDVCMDLGQDPIEFRLRHLHGTPDGLRLQRLLQVVRARSNESEPLPHNRSRGVACGVYHGTCVALVAEVELSDDPFRVLRLVAAIDAGWLVNPDAARAQAEGALTMGLSAALGEQVTVSGGMMQQGQFGTYRLLTCAETPAMDVTFVSERDEPFGVGEPPLIVVAPAVRNALRQLQAFAWDALPLRPGR